ncbi:MAG TPA: type II toxin-antitoxin system RelE/ParE family toxin [Rhizomicrobium sp.]|nr:type II toxin-antitoxin system RelE/ParE family toxin [Rhizomicrobium sp.]
MAAIYQSAIFRKWLSGLKDVQAKAAIGRRIERAEGGNFGDCKLVGNGVSEMRIKVGPGYRVYFVRRGERVYLLLLGGDKSSQAGDIKAAKKMAAELE